MLAFAYTSNIELNFY